MPRGTPVEICKIRFEKKGDALNYLRQILNKYTLNSRLNAEDEKFLRSALERHPEHEQKVGSGVDYFEVRAADYGTRCFWVVRVDGSVERFSYKSCVA